MRITSSGKRPILKHGPLVLAIGSERDFAALRGSFGIDECFGLATALTEAEAKPQVIVERPHLLLICCNDEGYVPTGMISRLVGAAKSRSLPVVIWSSLAGITLQDELGIEISDFVVGPRALDDLPSRLRAAIRREHPAAMEETIEVGDIRFEGHNARVTCRGRDIELGMIEFHLLAAMLERPNTPFDRKTLWNLVNGNSAILSNRSNQDSRALDTHVSRLRRAFTSKGECNVIRSVRGVGYALEPSGVPATRKSRNA